MALACAGCDMMGNPMDMRPADLSREMGATEDLSSAADLAIDARMPPDLRPPGPDLTGRIVVIVAPANDFSFSPKDLTINVGDTVTWVWDADHHNVISGNGTPDGKFCSPNNMNCATAPTNDRGFIYEFKFTQAGTYPYFCMPHLAFNMKGTITVH